MLKLHLLSRLLNLVMRVVDLRHPRDGLVKRLAELNVGADGPGSHGAQRWREIHIRRAVDEESPWARGGGQNVYFGLSLRWLRRLNML